VAAGDLPDADVVVATWWETAEWVAALPASKGAKAYFVQHHEVFPYLPVERAEATYRTAMPKIVVARWLADLMTGRYGNPDERVFLVPNGVDIAQFHAPPRERNAAPVVGMMYTTTPFKGADIALRAFDLAARNIPGLRLIAFGNEAPAASLPLPASATFHLRPPQSELRRIYAACDAWLFASRQEGFGLPLLEAMACRTPVIATPAGAAPELLDGGGGVLVQPEDSEDFSRAIERVCLMPGDEWRRMSDQAYETAMGCGWGDSVDRFEHALRIVAHGDGAGVSGRLES
jgi:glycosyltransferase involved in cell wall biosynthesis